jgi:hypothetical protein
MVGSSGRPTRCRKQAAMLVVWRAFLSRIARLWAAIVLVHQPHVPGSQHQQGHPALAQEQLREEQRAAGEQKQQRSSRASAVF